MKFMMKTSNLKQLDAKMLDDFKNAYLESSEKGFAERIQMSTFAVFSILFTFAHEQVHMIAIFAAISIFFSGWSLYSWRTFCILRKERKNLDEPLFIYGHVSAWRIFLFIPAVIVMIAILFMPGIFTKIFGYPGDSMYGPMDVIFPSVMAIVMVEFWRFFITVKDWSPRRHFVYVLLLAIAGLALFLYTAPIHRPPHFIDLM